jgi:hypothetical protein
MPLGVEDAVGIAWVDSVRDRRVVTQHGAEASPLGPSAADGRLDQ